MQLAALLDFAWTSFYAVPLAVATQSALRVPVAVSLWRAVLVGYTVSTPRIRERGAWILGQLMVSEDWLEGPDSIC